MIVSISEVKKNKKFQGIDEELLKRKILALENMIRKNTNNNFMDIRKRFRARIKENKIILFENTPWLSIDDNIQITHSLNDGVYTISKKEGTQIELLETNLVDEDRIIVTKVVYPPDIVEGVLKLLDYEFGTGKKIGIKSETISRHSVTYYDADSSNQKGGYPVSLLGFLEPYTKARF